MSNLSTHLPPDTCKIKLKAILEAYGDLLPPKQREYCKTYVSLDYPTYGEVGEAHGVVESTARRTIQRVLNRYGAKFSTVPQNQDEMLANNFTVERYTAEYDEDGNRKRHWIKAKQDQQQMYNDLVQSINELATELPKFAPKKVEGTVDDKLLAVYPLGDPHIGLLTYSPEVGQDWDLTIAEQVFMPLFANLVAAAPRCKECLIIDLGDFWHYDAMDQRTTRSGHKVDADGRPSKMIMVGYRIMLAMITYALEVHEVVNVKIMPGNHDDMGSIFLRIGLYHHFANEPRVNIDLTPEVFQYFQWYKCLIGIHHGDKCKPNNLPMVMAADRPELWGSTLFRYWYVGHFHHSSESTFKGKEQQGCDVETFRTIVPGEGYAHEAGYRPKQDGKCIVMHADYGEVERYTVNISQVR